MDSKLASRKLGYGFSSQYQEIALSDFVVNAKKELEVVPKFDPWRLISVKRKKKKLFDKQTKEDGYPTFDEDVLRYFGIDKWTDIYDYAEFFNNYIGGEEKTMDIIDKLLINNFLTKDFPERLVGGYNFDWSIINCRSFLFWPTSTHSGIHGKW